MHETTPSPSAATFKDRRGGLMAFGVVLIVLGLACVMLVALLLVAQLSMLAGTATASPGSPAPLTAGGYRTLLGVALSYGGLAVVLIWLGIGSILARRWARSLVLILSWTWLLTGVITVVVVAATLPTMISVAVPPGAEPIPEGARTAVVVGTTGCFGVFLVLLPVAFVLFYQSRHVKATCETRDPVVRWTDACPPSVLGLSVGLGLGAVSLPLMLVFNRPVLPWFGILVAGAPAGTAFVLMAAACAYCAWATCKLKPEGWWASVALIAAGTFTGIVTFWRVDPLEVYRLMGYPDEQIAQFRQLGFFTSGQLVDWTAIGSVLMFGYLWYVRKYFRRAVRDESSRWSSGETA